jgi:hypothetical protein
VSAPGQKRSRCGGTRYDRSRAQRQRRRNTGEQSLPGTTHLKELVLPLDDVSSPESVCSLLAFLSTTNSLMNLTLDAFELRYHDRVTLLMVTDFLRVAMRNHHRLAIHLWGVALDRSTLMVIVSDSSHVRVLNITNCILVEVLGYPPPLLEFFSFSERLLSSRRISLQVIFSRITRMVKLGSIRW